MVIDWFTVFAQIINFLILVSLLKVFLYRPVFEAIGKRKQEIEESIQSAKEKEKAAQDILREYENKKSSLEDAEKQILDEARATAKKELQDKRSKMESEIEELKNKKIEKIEKDQEKFSKYTTETFTSLIFEMSNRVIKELSGQKLDALIFDRFIDYLQEELPKIQADISEESNIKLSTAFELSTEQKNKFQTLINGLLKNAKTQFIIEKENLAGVNLLIGSYELCWSGSKALSSLKESISEPMKHTELLR